MQQGFTLQTIKLGFGEIQDLRLNLGFTANIKSRMSFSVGIGCQDEVKVGGITLEGTGEIVLGV